jgi:hypothetical protein
LPRWHHFVTDHRRLSIQHIVTVKTEVRDKAAIQAACQRLTLQQPEEGTFKLFSGEATGIAVRLPEWKFPVVCNTASGELRYDNYAGSWGKPEALARFLQAYAVERAKIEARRQGHSVTEQPLADGSIKLTIKLGGVA